MEVSKSFSAETQAWHPCFTGAQLGRFSGYSLSTFNKALKYINNDELSENQDAQTQRCIKLRSLPVQEQMAICERLASLDTVDHTNKADLKLLVDEAHGQSDVFLTRMQCYPSSHNWHRYTARQLASAIHGMGRDDLMLSLLAHAYLPEWQEVVGKVNRMVAELSDQERKQILIKLHIDLSISADCDSGTLVVMQLGHEQLPDQVVSTIEGQLKKIEEKKEQQRKAQEAARIATMENHPSGQTRLNCEVIARNLMEFPLTPRQLSELAESLDVSWEKIEEVSSLAPEDDEQTIELLKELILNSVPAEGVMLKDYLSKLESVEADQGADALRAIYGYPDPYAVAPGELSYSDVDRLVEALKEFDDVDSMGLILGVQYDELQVMRSSYPDEKDFIRRVIEFSTSKKMRVRRKIKGEPALTAERLALDFESHYDDFRTSRSVRAEFGVPYEVKLTPFSSCVDRMPDRTLTNALAEVFRLNQGEYGFEAICQRLLKAAGYNDDLFSIGVKGNINFDDFLWFIFPKQYSPLAKSWDSFKATVVKAGLKCPETMPVFYETSSGTQKELEMQVLLMCLNNVNDIKMLGLQLGLSKYKIDGFVQSYSKIADRLYAVIDCYLKTPRPCWENLCDALERMSEHKALANVLRARYCLGTSQQDLQEMEL